MSGIDDDTPDGLDREFEPVADDEREVELEEDGEPSPPPPTLDPDERVEDKDEEPLPDDERPA